MAISMRFKDEASATMTNIVDSVSKVTSIMIEIEITSDEQTLGISQINEVTRKMNSTTQQNAARVEHAAASCSMQSQVSDLSSTVSVFKLWRVDHVAHLPLGRSVTVNCAEYR